ncbi:peroxidasin homolog [Mytilus californianus]|uniref:peroxidasin homolog n=1 Tax=Mytilus californianus TaxID=6549 RepID=UPI00224620FF|nr:peroxidasin homolog [Mytilus californianus]
MSTNVSIVNISDPTKYSGGTLKIPALTILNANNQDAGVYKCEAENQVNSAQSNDTQLYVIEGSLLIVVSPILYAALAGDSLAIIQCNINGTLPATSWDWIKTPIDGGNAEVIARGTNNAERQVVNSASNPSLKIFSITEDDEGNYQCRASNGKWQAISGPAILKVLKASIRVPPGDPQIVGPEDIQVGMNVTLSCSSDGGNPPPSVVWMRDDMVISSGTNSSISGNVTTTTLTFTATEDDNRHVYECQVDNGFLQRPLVKTTYVALKNLHRVRRASNDSNTPPGQPRISALNRYNLGDTVTLACSSIGGNPLPSVYWVKDDNEITIGTSTYRDAGVTTTLTFTASLEDHLEVLECRADNGELSTQLVSTTYIELYFAPRAPIVNGPATLIAGSSGKWTCSSGNGYPAPTISMRIQDRQYTNDLTVVQSYDIIDRSYTVAGTLNLVPSSDKSGQNLCCDVSHLFDINTPQSVCMQLAIEDKEQVHIIIYIMIGIGTVFLLIILIFCYRKAYAIGRGKKREDASKYAPEAQSSNQYDYEDNTRYPDRDRNFDGLGPNIQEMHVYNTAEDIEENSHYMNIPADDYTYLEPISRTDLSS